jgi:hypothetical protein
MHDWALVHVEIHFIQIQLFDSEIIDEASRAPPH